MIRITIFFLGLLFLLLSSCQTRETLRVISMTSDHLWSETSWEVPVTSPREPADILIDPARRQQRIDGFGACFNEHGWDALMILDSVDREDVLSRIFDPVKGVQFNICRMPLGANDYSMKWYSYDEVPGDYDMTHFSIEHDREYLIPYIRAARKYAPELKIWASPWCPPVWMKTNKHYACRMDPVNDLCCKELEGQEGITQFIMNDRELTAYALYFAKFIQAYAKEGIEIFAVQPQNEPNSCQNFPSCIWKASDLATFIGEYLGPGLESHGLNTKIWYGTIERPHIENIDTVLMDPKAKKYIAGVGFQWAGKGVIQKTHEKYPDMKLMQTESECGDGSNDWDAAMHTFDLLQHYLNNGANSYMYWNMVLDETGKSHWGWKQNSLITVNRKTREVTYNPEFYLMKLFSSYVHPGAVKLFVEPEENVLAFRNPDDELLIVVRNPENRGFQKTMRITDKTYQLQLEPNSIYALFVNDLSVSDN